MYLPLVDVLESTAIVFSSALTSENILAMISSDVPLYTEFTVLAKLGMNSIRLLF